MTRKGTHDPNFDAAVADIPDGASIMLSGFAGPGTPRNLIAALFRQGAKELTFISNTPARCLGFARHDRLSPTPHRVRRLRMHAAQPHSGCQPSLA